MLRGMVPADLNHDFDEDKAKPYIPRPSFTKTAILLEPASDDAITVIRTPFGEQTFRGRFYLVAEGDASYGAAPDQFERAHEMTEPNQWVKSEPILAYQTNEECLIETFIGDLSEATVLAKPGDWIIKQPTGEVMVVGADAFATRYEQINDE